MFVLPDSKSDRYTNEQRTHVGENIANVDDMHEACDGREYKVTSGTQLEMEPDNGLALVRSLRTT